MDTVARRGSTPLVVADGTRVLGVVELKDIVKGGLKERFAELRRMGIKTVMITGDNRLTAAAIAAEAGVDDFLAEATPEGKLKLIREHQAQGRLVAMTGDGTNDAPALAQADVAVAMNTGTQAAKEAGNMVDLDSNPTKLIEVVETGKQMLMTRGALTTFSVANDVAKYFAIIPAAFAATYPQLERAERHGPRHAAVGDPLGGDLQRAGHHRAGPARAERRALHPGRRRGRAAEEPAGLRPGRHRRAVHRHQGDRSASARPVRPRVSAKEIPMLKARCQSIRALIVLTVITGVAYPLLVTGIAQLAFPAQANGSLHRTRRQGARLALIGQPFSEPKYFWGRPSATSPDALQRRRLLGLQPGADQPGAQGSGRGPRQGAARGRR